MSWSAAAAQSPSEMELRRKHLPRAQAEVVAKVAGCRGRGRAARRHLLPSNGLYLKPTQPSVTSHAAMHCAIVAPTSSPSLPSG